MTLTFWLWFTRPSVPPGRRWWPPGGSGGSRRTRPGRSVSYEETFSIKLESSVERNTYLLEAFNSFIHKIYICTLHFSIYWIILIVNCLLDLMVESAIWQLAMVKLRSRSDQGQVRIRKEIPDLFCLGQPKTKGLNSKLHGSQHPSFSSSFFWGGTLFFQHIYPFYNMWIQ